MAVCLRILSRNEIIIHMSDKAMKPYISVTNKKKAREMSKFDLF